MTTLTVSVDKLIHFYLYLMQLQMRGGSPHSPCGLGGQKYPFHLVFMLDLYQRSPPSQLLIPGSSSAIGPVPAHGFNADSDSDSDSDIDSDSDPNSDSDSDSDSTQTQSQTPSNPNDFFHPI